MAVRQPRYSNEEFTRRGTDIHERQIHAQVEDGNKGKIVAIDIETGDYAIGENILATPQSLFERNDDAQLWSVRVGHRALHHTWPRPLRKVLP